MPIYEYICHKCRRKMSFLVTSPSSFQPVCKNCKSTELEQLFSRFAMPKSEEKRLESLADPSSFSGLDENDPGSVARWMKKMGKEMGEDLGGEDIEQIAEEAAQEAGGGGGMGGEDGDGGAGPGDDL
ncbi:MAG TPA: zinc ribbon domain-containing protein [Acidobacteriota bacterium]|nr:zinc ribbon domain-containing protein [Acidobacteriota bacterium]